jgi:cytochrome c biogenesis protein CcdA/thiol-disulfide isomerase/thioredoxin
MILLILFAFLAGIVTVLSPCILPLLPIILSSSADTSGKKRPFGVVVGFVGSFTFFTLSLASIVKFTGIPAESLRFISIIILAVFGLSLLIPQVQLLIEQLFSRLARFAPQGQGKTGFFGGLVVGLSLGLLWTPCVGPILASVISLALSGSVNTQAVILTLSYSVGTAIPMFIIMLAGSTALQKVPWLVRNTGKIQKAFGVLMILTAVGIFFNIDRRFQTFILETFPQYGTGLTQFEDNQNIRKELEKVNGNPVDESMLGKPMLDTSKKIIAPDITAGGEWFNSEPLTLTQLKGKVVVIDFWTYSCINCQRTLPYLRDWWQKYKDQGLVIVGVHSPEFEFEKDAGNVSEAIQDFKLEYPIVQDNNFATWRAYHNRYWPAKYFIDKDGYVRFTHFGEGKYDESERVIQELLREAGSADMTSDVSNPTYQIYAKTPEIYLGNTRFNGQNYVRFEGNFERSDEHINPQKGAKLFLTFESKEVFLVMRPKQSTAKVKVYIDDKVQHLGEDNINGVVTINKDRLYKLIRLDTPGNHLLRLEFEDSNAEVFAFTFG